MQTDQKLVEAIEKDIERLKDNAQYYISIGMINYYNENMQKVAKLEAELITLNEK